MKHLPPCSKKVGLQIFFFNSSVNKVLICFNVQALVFLSISTFATQVGKGNIQKHGISMPWAPVPVVVFLFLSMESQTPGSVPKALLWTRSQGSNHRTQNVRHHIPKRPLALLTHIQRLLVALDGNVCVSAFGLVMFLDFPSRPLSAYLASTIFFPGGNLDTVDVI